VYDTRPVKPKSDDVRNMEILDSTASATVFVSTYKSTVRLLGQAILVATAL
jgi:hypothetical protein